jgi:predicted lactoylglutathione lyase
VQSPWFRALDVRSFQDPDGHQWEFFWMDPSFVQK